MRLGKRKVNVQSPVTEIQPPQTKKPSPEARIQSLEAKLQSLETTLQSQENKIQSLGNNIDALIETNFRTRVMLKQAHGIPIKVLFVCHEPTLWSMFESVYQAMAEDSGFSPLVVAMPYKHSTLPEGQYKDAGMLELCEKNGIKAIKGYDKEKDEWLDPAPLMPDYVFFQTPYDFFVPAWSVEKIYLLAKVCYIPYTALVSKGEVAAMQYPESFLRHTSFYFLENPLTQDAFINRFAGQTWFKKERAIVTGYPKLDYLNETTEYTGKVWRRGTQKGIKRILWTPRWVTSEGVCHFFDYKDYFFEFCKNHPDVDFVFRPHPLCFQNFIKTGEMPLEEQNKMRHEYEMSLNMAIDENRSYLDTFWTSDLLISDFSSILIQYYSTGKPIIYTHRTNLFSDYALALSEGMYWVQNVKELDETISMILSGDDPLRQKREELKNKLIFVAKGGAGRAVKEQLYRAFQPQAQ